MVRTLYLKWRVDRAASLSELCELKAWQRRSTLPQAVQKVISRDRTPYEYLRRTEFPLFQTDDWLYSVPDWQAMKGMHSEEEDAQVLLIWLLQDAPKEVFYSFCKVYKHILLGQPSRELPLKKKLTQELKPLAFGLESSSYGRERRALQKVVEAYSKPRGREYYFLHDDMFTPEKRDSQHLLDELEVSFLLHGGA